MLPLIGFVLTVWLWTSLPGTALEFGLIWLAIGFVWLLGVTRGVPAPDARARYEGVAQSDDESGGGGVTAGGKHCGDAGPPLMCTVSPTRSTPLSTVRSRRRPGS